MDRIEELTKKLEQGIKELYNSDKYKQYLSAMSKFHNYSPSNIMLILQQNPNASYVAGYNAWADKFSRQVNKGEKALFINVPFPLKDKITKEPLLDEQGNEIIHYRMKPKVFDISQTNGEPLPVIGVRELEGNVNNYEPFFNALRDVSPVDIKFRKIITGAKGFYSPAYKEITINQGMSEIQNIKTAIHEIAHARLHSENDGKSKAIRELEAESIAYVVCQKYGIDTADYSFGYLASWSNPDEDMKQLKSVLAVVQKEANSIIKGLDEQFKELEQMRNSEKSAPIKKQHNENYVSPMRVEEARKVCILEYLMRQEPGNIVKSSANEYKKASNDSFKIFPSKNGGYAWKWHSQQMGGTDAISYIQKTQNISFQEAVKELTPHYEDSFSQSKPKANATPTFNPILQEKKEFEMPLLAKQTSKVEEYLINKRGIDPDIVRYCIENKILGQTDKYGNCIFLGLDENNEPKSASTRGTYDEKPYKGKVANSNTEFAFFIPVAERYKDTAKTLFIFESPIEAMSKASMDKSHPTAGHMWNAVHRLSLDGLSDIAIHKYLENNPGINNINLCLNGDEPGQKGAARIEELLRERYNNQYKIAYRPPEGAKDYNEMLKPKSEPLPIREENEEPTRR